MKKLWIVCCLLALLLAGSALADTSGTCGDQTVWTMSAPSCPATASAPTEPTSTLPT